MCVCVCVCVCECVRIQTSEVVRMASMVPMGMERWASFRSPERFDPAMIPDTQSSG